MIMRKSRYLTLLFGILAIAGLTNCSRESSVKEDVSLQNNHSRVFAQREAFDDPKAFADSMANTAFDSSDSLSDTLTVTVNDTVYLMGILPRNVDKIYRFQWNLTKADGKDTVILGNNATPQAWSYSKEGVYYPMFIAFDGNNSTDTAGTNTKRTYINVINTKPVLTVPKDTLWTSNKGNVTFPITAQDTFGFIKKVLVDLDASGKEEPKEWKYETRKNNDSLYLTIKNDPKKIDSLGNQKIYVIVVDDDNNETLDSVNLHFNRIPRLEILYPKDGERHNMSEPFYFYYEGKDDDNPKDLRYFIYAQNGKNGNPPAKAFDSDDLIAENFMSTKCNFWLQDEKRNAISLITNPKKELTGRIYWDMYVTDGYDIVHMKSIPTGDNTSRPWNFYIGDISSTQGSISGIARYQGRSVHSGIDVELSNGINTFTGKTDSIGYYSIKVDAGVYSASAKSSIGEYAIDTLLNIYVESGALVTADSMELKDTVPPMVLVKVIDTLTVRDFKQTIYVRDLGSRIKSVTATRNKASQPLTCVTTDQGAVANCELKIDKQEDGTHEFVYTAIDSVGNKKEIKQAIVVNATSLTLDVNGAQKQLIGEGETLTFNAKIINAYPAAQKVTWTAELEDSPITKTTSVNEDGEATFSLSYEDIKKAVEGKDYTMTVAYAENNVKLNAQVKFGVLGNNPAVIFTEPASTITVTKNDPVLFKVSAYPGKSSTDYTLTWNCGTNLSSGYTCPEPQTKTAKFDTEATLAYSTTGKYKVIVNVKDNSAKESYDTVEVVVVKDPPTVHAATNSSSNKYKINSKVSVTVDASDKFGTVNKISWGCSNGKVTFDNEYVLPTPSKTISDHRISLQMPGTETDNYRCVIKATDDDEDEGFDTLTFKVLLDPPVVKVATKQASVKINSVQTITAIASDELGYITEYAIACDESLANLKSPSWEIMTSNKINKKMPSTNTKYYCVVQVKDDDNLTAKDTATYTVLLDPPTVRAVLGSGYETVTINDELPLDAIARDEMGRITKIEWGCGVLSSTPNANNIGLNISAGTDGSAVAIMPAAPQNKYSCIVQVTDDDGLTARDTIHTKVLLAPPTVKVNNKTLTVREGFNMALGAVATDDNGVPSDPGAIVKREWSCGIPNEIDRNWKTVSAYDTVWKAPAPQVSYYCVARATDNDGNVANDTTVIKFSTEQPLIQVQDEVIYINIGDPFTLSATVNSVWQGIDWFSWECKDASTGKSFEKDGKVPLYDYKANGGKMTISKDSSYSEHGKDMYCIVKAQETSTQATFSDTTTVRILKQHPIGVITAPDTVYLWSGDDNVDDNALYFFDKSWGGQNSIMGELGDAKNKVYNWRFSGKDNGYYVGNPDGSLDTNIAQFNNAFKRRTAEGSMTMYLDFRDSSTKSPSLAFYSRHRAEEVSHTIYFRKAWKNQGKDTVIENTGAMNIAPALTILSDNPVEVYQTGTSTVKARVLKSGSWTDIATATSTTDLTEIKAISDGTNLYIGLLDKNNKFSVYKSEKGTSAFANIGTPIDSVASPQLLYNPSSKSIAVLYINAKKKLNNIATYSSSQWKKAAIAGKDNLKFRELNAAFLPNGTLVVTAVDTTTDFNLYYSMYDATYKELKAPENIARDVNKMTLATTESKIYFGFSNRDVELYGPYVYEGTVNSKSITWNKSGVFGRTIFEGFFAYHMSIATRNNAVYVALDDNGRADNAQVHVFKLGNGQWHFYGENQLPYFNAVFYESNNYYLRGSSPQLAFDDAGRLYISMLGRESGSSKPNRNNGPIVMKYVAENWEK